jgi:DinB superfamily
MTFQLPEQQETLATEDLAHLTTASVDEVRKLLRRCADADVVFVPNDPLAYDPGAATSEEASVGWTLGHIIVHMTASAEEAAMLAAEQARGVPFHGRSRSETPWTTITTVAQCRARLNESRRMRLASLGTWPDVPQLATPDPPDVDVPAMGSVARFVSGLKHDAEHMNHLREVIHQARDYRFQQTLLGRLRRRLTKRAPSDDQAMIK